MQSDNAPPSNPIKFTMPPQAPRPTWWQRVWQFFDQRILGPKHSSYRKRMVALVILIVVVFGVVAARRIVNFISVTAYHG